MELDSVAKVVKDFVNLKVSDDFSDVQEKFDERYRTSDEIDRNQDTNVLGN